MMFIKKNHGKKCANLFSLRICMENLSYIHEMNTSWRSVPIYRGKTALFRQQCVVRRVVFNWQAGRIWLSLQIRLSTSAAHGRDTGRVSSETSFVSKQPKLEPKLVSALSETRRLFRCFALISKQGVSVFRNNRNNQKTNRNNSKFVNPLTTRTEISLIELKI
jgi:hypothetical protein